MRENPWHLRLPTIEHYQWFHNLIALHEFTLECIKKVNPTGLPDFVKNALSPEIAENLSLLNSLSDVKLETLLDDTLPEDLLGRLEHAIWAIQSVTILHLDKKENAHLKPEINLEEISHQLGTNLANKRWAILKKKYLNHVDSRDILLAMNDTPLSGYPYGNGFLIKRAIKKEIQIELRACPHRVNFHEVLPAADRLCTLQSFWTKGFIKALNPMMSLEHEIKSPRCIQRWHLA